jgi:undecaprenyl-diphosphatase
MIPQLDVSLTTWLNHFVGKWPFFDWVAYNLSGTEFPKGVVFALVYWYFLFEEIPGESQQSRILRRGRLLAALFLVVPALFLARAMAHFMPFRQRPFFSPLIHFQWPYHSDTGRFINWSSFPSDHAVLFVALATALYFRNKLVGALALIYVLIIVLFPRVYLGYHWPTDILAGSAMGVATAFVTLTPAIRRCSTHFYESWQLWNSGSFAAFMFFLTYEIATLFEGPRLLATTLAQALKAGGGLQLR